MAKQNKPAIRFKGFTDAWEQRKAKDLCSISTGKSNTQDRVDDGIYPFYVRSPIVEHSNRYLFDEEAVLTVGDGVGTGKVFHYVNGKYDLHQRVYRMFDFSEEITAKYFYYYFSNHFYDRVMAMTAKTSVDSVRYEMIADMDIALPKVKEQMAISAYFDRLDHLITLHQRKYDKLQVLKKAMLEKMFPKNGSSVPEIRFKGFTDAWEQRKLEDYLTVSAEKNTDNLYTKKDVLSVSGDFGVVNQIEFQGRSFAGASVSNYGVVHTGDVVYTKSPLKANPYGIIKANKGKPGIVSVLYGVYHTRENANADFIQMYFEQDARLNNYLRPLVNKGAKNTLLISDTDALEGEVCLAPTFDEQKAIGQFFDSLDNLITLHQRELEKLQNIKKSMLEKMFV